MTIGRGTRGAGGGSLLIAALWIWLTQSLGCTQPDPEGRVAGSGTELGNVMGILVSPDRKPAPGVEVVLYPLETELPLPPTLKDTTAADGSFAFQVDGGSYRLLTLDGAGNGATVDSLFPDLMDTIDLQEVDLAPLGGIRGYVKSQPQGSRLGLYGTPFDTAFATDTGFVWEGIPAGTYWLQARQAPGMVASNSVGLVVSIAPGIVTELPDTLDLSVRPLELLSAQLPYRVMEMVRPADGRTIDSAFWILNGARVENQGPSARHVDITLTETMLDSTRANSLQFFVHSGDSLFAALRWSITWSRSQPVKFAYQAVRAVMLAMEPDNRTGGGQLGTFRVLQSRRLAPEDLQYWEWPAAAGGDVTVSETVQASIRGDRPQMIRGCSGPPETPLPNIPGDTVTFFLLPDSILGAIAYRLRTDERFEDMDRLGYFARADWPLGSTFILFDKQMVLRTDLRPEGLQIEWPLNFNFEGSQNRCQSTFRRFLLDSAGRVREIAAVPDGIDPARLLLLYRAGFTEGIDADSLPASGAYVFVDSTGFGVAGTADTVRAFRLDAEALAELETLVAALPDPPPADWHQELRFPQQSGPKDALRYLVGDGRSALHIAAHPGAVPAKADLFSRVETWLRGRNLL